MEQKERELFRIVRRRAVVGAALIFLGVFVLQIIVSAGMEILAVLWFQLSGQGKDAAVQYFADQDHVRTFIEYRAILMSIVFILWCGFLYLRSEWRERPDYRQVFSGKHIRQILCLGFCGCFLAILFLSMLQNLFPALLQDYQASMDQFNTGTVLMFLYTLLLGPMAEELIFRGAVFDRLYLAFPFWIANLIQALLFGLYHGNLVQGIYACLFGLLLGAVHHTGGSIWNNILMHIVFNMTNFLVPVVSSAAYQIHPACMILLYVLCLCGFIMGIRSIRGELANVQHTSKI